MDLTPATATPGTDWPAGREDHGFAYDPDTGLLYTFAGEGAEERDLGDLWSYDIAAARWQPIAQRYQDPNGQTIAAREIYNISDDHHGHFLLFGGAYLQDADGAPIHPLYVNDLWRLDLRTQTWTLIGGKANAYDPSLPLPRHYYGQACDVAGNFYVLGGFASDGKPAPYFAGDRTSLHAHPARFQDQPPAADLYLFALDDFWQYAAATGQWADLSETAGGLAGDALIPYALLDTGDGRLLTFGGFHTVAPGILAASSEVWTRPIPPVTAPASATATGTARTSAMARQNPPPAPAPAQPRPSPTSTPGSTPTLTPTSSSPTPTTPQPETDTNPPR